MSVFPTQLTSTANRVTLPVLRYADGPRWPRQEPSTPLHGRYLFHVSRHVRLNRKSRPQPLSRSQSDLPLSHSNHIQCFIPGYFRSFFQTHLRIFSKGSASWRPRIRTRRGKHLRAKRKGERTDLCRMGMSWHPQHLRVQLRLITGLRHCALPRHHAQHGNIVSSGPVSSPR